MNSAVLHTVSAFQRRYLKGVGEVLDVGSMNVGCRWSGRDLWTPPIGPAGWTYTGADIAPGSNVDVVLSGERFDLHRQFDVVMSSGCLEHTERSWKVFESMANHVRPGGYLYSLVPWIFTYHPYPIDCWRISPDGWRVLCKDNGLELVEAFLWRNTFLREKTLVGLALNAWMRVRYGTRAVESVVIARKA